MKVVRLELGTDAYAVDDVVMGDRVNEASSENSASDKWGGGVESLSYLARMWRSIREQKMLCKVTCRL